MRTRIRIKQLVALALTLVVLVMLPVELSAVEKYYNYKNAALTTTSTNVDCGFQAHSILVNNLNAAAGITIYVDWAGGTANSSDNEILAGASRSYTASPVGPNNFIGMRSVSLASASATSSVQVLCLR